MKSPGSFLFAPVLVLLGLPLSRALAVDYTIAFGNSGATLVVTNSSGNADTLTVSEPSSGTISFAAPGRTFTGSGTTGTSGSISRSGVSLVVINGGETINVGALGGGSNLFPSLTINGGTGNDTVNFTGNINFNSGYSLSVNLQSGSGSHGADTITVSNNANLVVRGTGAIDLECSRNISVTGGGLLQTEDGTLTLAANQQATATTGSFSGVYLDGSATRVQVTGGGLLNVSGTGGNGSGGYKIGVDVEGGAQILQGNGSGGGGNVIVTGTGGASTGIVNRGVTVYGSGSAIACNSSLGSLGVTGSAGKLGSGYGIGVSVLSGGQISDTGDGTTLNGTGGGASGDSNQGVGMGGANSAMTSTNFVSVTGVPGPGTSVGLTLATSAALGSSSTPEVNIYTDSVSIDNTATITSSGSGHGVEFVAVAATHLNLGGDNATGTLGLTAAKLARSSTPALYFRTGSAGDITISAGISFPTTTSVYLFPGSGGLKASASGVDLSLALGAVRLNGPLRMPITGANADTGYPQLNVAGGVILNSTSTLDLTGTTFAGSAGQTFTIIANDMSEAVSGTFANLPEGTYLQWPSNTSLAARISYVGGTGGNDVALTLVPVAQALTVTTTAGDSSVGSLPTVLAFAAAHSGAETVTFASSLSGQTITLSGPANGYAITVSDAAGVTLDASNLTGGLTIQGGGASGTFGLFNVASGSSLTLRGLTLANGGGSNLNSQGGALLNNGTVNASGCVFTGNSIPGSAGNGGAIYSASGTSLTLTNCTFAANAVTGTTGAGGAISNDGTTTVNTSTFNGNSAVSGGAVLNNGNLTLTQCTLVSNISNGFGAQGGALYSGAGTVGIVQCTVSLNSSSSGGGIYKAGSNMYLANSIVAGNTAGTGADLTNANAASSFVIAGANVIQGNSGSFSGNGTVNSNPPLLAPLGNYGANTQTMALLIGSPARNSASGSAFTTDQRGFAITDGHPDIGAYEAGDITNYNAWIYENLPANTSTNAAVHAATYDYDGDSVSNYNEWLEQTNPSDATSYLHVTQTTFSGTTLTVTFPGVAGRNYVIEGGNDLATWTQLDGPLAGTGSPITRNLVFATGTPSKYFVRVRGGP